jgi:hypothetical protein
MSVPSTTSVEPHPSAFTTLWTAEQVRKLRRAGLIGQPVSTTFGGPHTSAPRFSNAGVRPGDDVFPINIRDGRLMLLGRIRVGEILRADAFVARHPDLFDPILRHPEFRRLEPHLDSATARAFWQLRLWLEDHPELDAFCPGEADEVVIAMEASPVRLDVAVPPDSVKTLRWQPSRKPARPIKHLSAAGRIERSISLQGIYRLAPDSADLLRTLILQSSQSLEGAR